MYVAEGGKGCRHFFGVSHTLYWSSTNNMLELPTVLFHKSDNVVVRVGETTYSRWFHLP